MKLSLGAVRAFIEIRISFLLEPNLGTALRSLIRMAVHIFSAQMLMMKYSVAVSTTPY